MEEFTPLVIVEPKKKRREVQKVPKNPIKKRPKTSSLENNFFSSPLNFKTTSINPPPQSALIAAKNTGFTKPTPYLVITGNSPARKTSDKAKKKPFRSLSISRHRTNSLKDTGKAYTLIYFSTNTKIPLADKSAPKIRLHSIKCKILPTIWIIVFLQTFPTRLHIIYPLNIQVPSKIVSTMIENFNYNIKEFPPRKRNFKIKKKEKSAPQ
jgi:hypothetical protein